MTSVARSGTETELPTPDFGIGMLEPGAEAPEFELPDQDGETVSLSGIDGRVVLYFYPRADTSGCTVEAKGFRDRHALFADAGVTILGISTDPVEDVAAFAEKYDLPFDLLADEDGAVSRAYDCYRPADDGRGSARRVTYVVLDGEIEQVYGDVSPEGHADELLADLGIER